MEKTVLKNMLPDEMRKYFTSIGEPAYRADQIFKWIYKGADVDDMRNVPKSLREKLHFDKICIVDKQVSKDGTRKYLFELDDGNRIESVFMKYSYGNSVCISSQAGCAMGCSFCASGIGGLKRNLEAWEMAAQVLEIEKETGEKVNHIVVMGTGEPFSNYENLSRFLKLMHEPSGFGLSYRNITVSTCGLVPYILKFAEDFPQVTLAISLHAANNEKRSDIMKINNTNPIVEVMAAARKYSGITGRRVTFEYALIRGVNDSDEDALELAGLLKGTLSHVNLIPLNEVNETGLKSSANAKRFKDILEREGVAATVRRELGSDIDAACGQLRLKSGNAQD